MSVVLISFRYNGSYVGCEDNPVDRDGQGRGLSFQAESGGAGRGAWEISPAT
jgi:hypothetical protein